MRDIKALVLEAARNNDDTLDDLLQEAIEQLDEQQANHLLDVVEQIMKEGLRDALGWIEEIPA